MREKRGENNGQNGNLPGAKVIAEPEERRYFFIFLTRSWRRERDRKFTRKKGIAKWRDKVADRRKSSNRGLACVRECAFVFFVLCACLCSYVCSNGGKCMAERASERENERRSAENGKYRAKCIPEAGTVHAFFT